MTTSRLALVRDLDFEEDLPRDSFTMAVSRQDFPGVGLGRDAILIRPQIDGGPAVMGSARAVSAGISTTVDRVVRIQGIHRLERPLPMGTLVACHEHGTGVAGFLPGSWDHLDCQSWDHPACRAGGSWVGSLDRRVVVAVMEVYGRGIQGGQCG